MSKSKASRRRGRRDRALAAAAREQAKQEIIQQVQTPAAAPTEQHPAPAEFGEGGLSTVADQRLLGRAIRRRWGLGPAEKRKAIKATISNLANDDGRVINGAVRNLLLMESQNMEQEKLAAPPASPASPTAAAAVNVNILNANQTAAAIQVVESDDWYGTKAAAAEADEAAAEIDRHHLNGNGHANGHHNGSGSNGHHLNGNGNGHPHH